MLGRSQAILGVSTTAVVLTARGTNIIEDPAVFFPALIVGILASLLPDIDSPQNTLRKTFGIGKNQAIRELKRWRKKGFFSVILDIIQVIIAQIFDVVEIFLPHRGPTHWGFTAYMLTFFVYWACLAYGWPSEIWIAFGAGYASHLLGDGVTKIGVRLWAPIYPKFVHFVPKPIRIRTGSPQEELMLLIIVGLQVGILFLFA